MSQISPPIRILLVCAVAFMAAWMLVLRPKDDAGTPVAAAPSPAATPRPVEAGGKKSQSLAGKAVEKANEATAAQDAQAEEAAGGAGEDTVTPPAAATAPAPTRTGTVAPVNVATPTRAALARVPAGVRHAIEQHKIVVLAVVTPKGTDDRLLRRQLRHVDKLHGRVFVRSVPVRKVARYTAITRGVNLQQTPTTVVIGLDLKAVALIGWVDARTIDQSVVDALRGSRALFKNAYLREVDKICRTVPLDVKDTSTVSSPATFTDFLGRFATFNVSAKRDIAALDAPPTLRVFHRRTQEELGAMAATLTAWRTALGKKPTAAKLLSTKHFRKTYNQHAREFTSRMESVDLIGCTKKG
jgi:hypothetical protein